jgi:hypothetical protein
MGHPDGKWARPDGQLKTQRIAFLTRAIRTGEFTVRTVLGQHLILQSSGAARSEASGWAANGALGF